MEKFLYSLLIVSFACNASEWQLKRQIAGLLMPQTLAFSADGSRFAMAENSGGIRGDGKPFGPSKLVQIFSTQDTEPLSKFEHEGVAKITFDPTNNNRLGLTAGRAVAIWDINNKVRISQAEVDSELTDCLNCLAFNSNATQMVASCGRNAHFASGLCLYDTRSDKFVKVIEGGYPVIALQFSGDNKVRGIGFNDETHVFEWDLASDAVIAKPAQEIFAAAAYTNNGRVLVNDGHLYTLDDKTLSESKDVLVDGRKVRTLRGAVAITRSEDIILYHAEREDNLYDKVCLLGKTE